MTIKQTTSKRPRRQQHPLGGTPMWNVAYLFPAQGDWTEDDYLNLEDRCGSHIRVELFNGRLEILPVPTQTHQFIIWFLMKALELFVRDQAPGVVLFSGIRMKIPSKSKKPQFREPDIIYMKAENAHRRHDAFWEGADLAMEVVSGTSGDRARDLVTKRREYAAAGISEYWIIDPDENKILVLTLNGKTYKVHGDFGRGMQADSVLLPGFTVSVDQVLDAGKENEAP